MFGLRREVRPKGQVEARIWELRKLRFKFPNSEKSSMTDFSRKTGSELASIQVQGRGRALSRTPRWTTCTTSSLAEKPSPKGIGTQLREIRNQLKLTLRETQERCAQFAQQWDNDAYRISASWLDRVERENRGLSATKLIVLVYIYNLSTDQMLSLCPGSNKGSAQLLQASSPNSTLLLTQGPFERCKDQFASRMLNHRHISSSAPICAAGRLGLQISSPERSTCCVALAQPKRFDPFSVPTSSSFSTFLVASLNCQVRSNPSFS